MVADVVVGTDRLPARRAGGRNAAILKKTGMTLNDIDLIENNEASPPSCWAGPRSSEPDMSKLNVNGGAIALGHPVGCTGSRLIVTALARIERRNKSTALMTHVLRSAVGVACIIERL